jgi:hypothetical protein
MLDPVKDVFDDAVAAGSHEGEGLFGSCSDAFKEV